VYANLIQNNFRAEIDASEETLSKRIRNAELEKIPLILVVGGKEKQNKTVAVRKRGSGDLGAFSLEQFKKQFLN